MRNQIKKMIKKENGFTLVELLAVLVILGIIVAIAIPAVGNIIDNARGDANEAEQELVIDAARLYFIENEGTEVDVETLISEGYLEERGEASDLTGTVTKSDGEYTYTE
ncbi:competence type IV pilus major pilin ComGC [Marinilactibacillus psychrotolerans]|uniref:competence type IV pilus major pilin ComGC n=1 Tax=Marinilactibacillus psychrotolerans TaxID=191770 RepID=UPI003889C274